MRAAARTYFLVWLWLGAVTARAQHEGDILIGQTTLMRLGATNLPARTIYLSPVSSGAFQGWSSTVLGFDGIVTNAADALQPLIAGANVFLEVVTIDPGLSLRSFTAPATVFADEAGERLRIGSTGNLHNHPIIFIDRSVVGTNFAGQRTVVFRLVDTGTAGLLPSPDYSMSFAPVVPTRLDLTRTPDGITLSFATREGLAYQIQAASSLNGAWVAEGNLILGTGTIAQLNLSTTSSNKFFRVRSIPDN
jgi:hypothetical protein